MLIKHKNSVIQSQTMLLTEWSGTKLTQYNFVPHYDSLLEIGSKTC